MQNYADSVLGYSAAGSAVIRLRTLVAVIGYSLRPVVIILFFFLADDADAVNSYRGEYMSGYSWASNMEGFITGKRGRIIKYSLFKERGVCT